MSYWLCPRWLIVGVLAILIIAVGRSGVFATQERVIWSFGGPGDGAVPSAYANLLAVDGKLYGVTVEGGANASASTLGGTVFQLAPPARDQSTWSEKVLWSFASFGNGDGSYPNGALIKLGDSLYGTTFFGGSYGDGVLGGGTAFQLTPPAPGQTNWNESILWSFGGPGDGAELVAGLTEAGGKLYGTASVGGANLFGGAVFELTLTPSGWSESLPWSFPELVSGPPFSGSVFGGLIKLNGKLYGTTVGGGAYSAGTVYQLTPPAPGQSNWSEEVLWSFGGPGDGAYPVSNLLARGGKLYGTTPYGGANSCSYYPYASGCGIVFQLTPPAPGQTNWSERVIWNFGGPGDGANPYSSLLATDGKLYGTTPYGGANACTGSNAAGCGAAFQLTPPPPGQTNWTETVVWSFGGAGDGASPYAGLIRAGGAIYGTTASGGSNNAGTVFAIAP